MYTARKEHHLMRIKLLAGAAGLLLAPSLGLATSAQATPFDSGDGYPRFANEGSYPESTSCNYRLLQSRSADWHGRSIRLKYFYSGGCGSFARIENAPRECSVWLDRTPDGDTVGGWDYVGETVDPGIDYAYTQVGNNLSGRLSRGALVCHSGGTNWVIARTGWY
jgi:hypothetical protein